VVVFKQEVEHALCGLFFFCMSGASWLGMKMRDWLPMKRGDVQVQYCTRTVGLRPRSWESSNFLVYSCIQGFTGLHFLHKRRFFVHDSCMGVAQSQCLCKNYVPNLAAVVQESCTLRCRISASRCTTVIPVLQAGSWAQVWAPCGKDQGSRGNVCPHRQGHSLFSFPTRHELSRSTGH